MKVGATSASVLRELAITIKSMTKSNKIDILVVEMNNAAQELQNLLKSYPNTHNNNNNVTEEGSPAAKTEIPLMDIIQVVTVVSLLVEIVARVEDIVIAVSELSNLAKFQPAISKCDKSEQHRADSKISPCQLTDEQAIKTIQMV